MNEEVEEQQVIAEPEQDKQAIAENDHIDTKAEELARDFTYDGYQVVRRELFAHLREPAAVIRYDSITFNTACIAGLEDVVYIQVLVNPDEQRMVIRRCEENDKDAIRWCVAKPDGRKSRKVTGKIFSAKMYDLMGWDPNYRYKILGHKIVYEDEMIYVFDLTETEIFLNKKRGRKKANEADAVQATGTAADAEAQGKSTGVDGGTQPRPASGRQAYLPESWKDTFGLPVEEHKKALQINLREGYAEFATS